MSIVFPATRLRPCTPKSFILPATTSRRSLAHVARSGTLSTARILFGCRASLAAAIVSAILCGGIGAFNLYLCYIIDRRHHYQSRHDLPCRLRLQSTRMANTETPRSTALYCICGFLVADRRRLNICPCDSASPPNVPNLRRPVPQSPSLHAKRYLVLPDSSKWLWNRKGTARKQG